MYVAELLSTINNNMPNDVSDGSISTANATKTGLDAIISGTDYEQVTLDLAKVKEDIDFQVSSAKPSKGKMWFELLN